MFESFGYALPTLYPNLFGVACESINFGDLDIPEPDVDTNSVPSESTTLNSKVIFPSAWNVYSHAPSLYKFSPQFCPASEEMYNDFIPSSSVTVP